MGGWEAQTLPQAKERRTRGVDEQSSQSCCPGGLYLKLGGAALCPFLGRSRPLELEVELEVGEANLLPGG